MAIILLKELHDGSDMWSISVRIMRKWNVYQKWAPTELFCVSMVLLDAEGNKIQASVLNKDMLQQFRRDIHEGETYAFDNFIVSKNTYKFRPTNHPFKITFTPFTSINRENVDLPLFSYNFKRISELLNLPENENIDYLFDVIGFASNVGALEDVSAQSQSKYRMRMVLNDEEY